MQTLDVRIDSERILILTPFGKDATHLSKILSVEGFECLVCHSIQSLVDHLSAVGAVLVSEEVLARPEAAQLTAALKAQPAWSAIPILAFFGTSSSKDAVQKKASHPLQEFADINFLQKPLAVQTLISAVKSALRDRRRQYQTSHLLERLNQDIAKKEQIEKKLKDAKDSAEKAKEVALIANSSKSQFLANVSHEIRTPLGAIIGFLELVKSVPGSPEEHANYISVIERNSVQLLRLIDDILDLSKVEAGKMTIEKTEFQLINVILDCASLMTFKAREKGILFVLRLENKLPEYVISDPIRLRQILMNVVGNAVKFTSKGIVELILGFHEQELCMTVNDTGRGISEDQRSRLFKAFSQADNSTTRHFGGTGLGLTLTRNLTEAMGGSFELTESQLNKGSTFVARVQVEIPKAVRMVDLSAREDKKPSSLSSEDAVLQGLRILVVEDSADNQALFTIWLSKLGAEVSVASDGQKGVELALKSPYDIVLMDIQMPNMDGYQATEVLRKNGYKVPIIALTAHAMKEERERTRASGFSGFLSKPAKKDTLVAAVVANTLTARVLS